MAIAYEFRVPIRHPHRPKTGLVPKGSVLTITDVETLASFFDAFEMEKICKPVQDKPNLTLSKVVAFDHWEPVMRRV